MKKRNTMKCSVLKMFALLFSSRCARSSSVAGSSRRSSSFRSGRSSSVGSGRSCWLGGRSGCCGGSLHRSGCGCGYWSGFFLLATSGECSCSDQGGQNERVLHFDFPIGTDIILKSHGVRLSEALLRFGPMHLGCTYWRSRRLYWYLVNTG